MPRDLAVEFDGRYRFPYRVIQTNEGIRMVYSRHKTRHAADERLKKRARNEAYFEETHMLAEPTQPHEPRERGG